MSLKAYAAMPGLCGAVGLSLQIRRGAVLLDTGSWGHWVEAGLLWLHLGRDVSFPKGRERVLLQLSKPHRTFCWPLLDQIEAVGMVLGGNLLDS